MQEGIIQYNDLLEQAGNFATAEIIAKYQDEWLLDREKQIQRLIEHYQRTGYIILSGREII